MDCGGTCCREVPVLDLGHVRLVAADASDSDVVQAARVSYGKGTKDPETDRKLIGYLMRNHHNTPFEHTYMKFHVKAPIFVARQWFRHRIGVSYNEISMRYTEAKDEFYIPYRWRTQDAVNKQGSAGVIGDSEHVLACAVANEAYSAAMIAYRCLLESGIAREQARIVLPVALYTEWYWTVNAGSLMHFLRLRLDEHAQWETRQYAVALLSLFRDLMPWTVEAFESCLPKK